jgi:hypothetical protein
VEIAEQLCNSMEKWFLGGKKTWIGVIVAGVGCGGFFENRCTEAISRVL